MAVVHRSHEMSKPTKIALGAGAALMFFLVTWVFLPWWGAVLVTAGAALLFTVAEHIDWSRIWER